MKYQEQIKVMKEMLNTGFECPNEEKMEKIRGGKKEWSWK